MKTDSGGNGESSGDSRICDSRRSMSPFSRNSPLQGLRTHFITGLEEQLSGRYTLYEGPVHAQLPHVIGLGIHGLEGQWLMLECNRRGMGISTGSACGAGSHDLPKTLQSMGVSQRAGKEFIRISFGRDTREEQIAELVNALADIHASLTSSLT